MAAGKPAGGRGGSSMTPAASNFGAGGKSKSRDMTPAEYTKFKISFNQEQGSAFQLDDIFFASYQGGEVFDLGIWQAQDMQEMLRKDSTAGAIQRVLTGPVRAASWDVKPAPGDKGEAQFISEFLQLPASQGGMKVPMQTLIAQALSARTYRRAFFEKVYKQDKNGRIVYDKIAFRPAGTCSIRRDPKTGAYLGFKQRPIRKGIQPFSDFGGIDIDPPYAWVHVNGQHIDPIKGYSDMEIPYWCHLQKMKLLFLWFTFLETQATPRVVVSSANDLNVDSNAAKIAQLKGGGVAGVPDKVTLHTVESNGQGAKLFSDAIQWLDRCAIESVLAGFLNLTGAASVGTRGSMALSKDASSFFLEQEQATANELQESISRDVIAPLVFLNFGPDAAVPQFEFGTIGDGDIDRLVSLITGLSAQATSPFPAAFLFALAEKAGNYLDLDMAALQDEMDKAQAAADESASIALEQKKVALQTAKNPPAPNPMKPGGPVSSAVKQGAPGFGAAVNTIAKKVQSAQSAKPAAKPAASNAGGKPAKRG